MARHAVASGLRRLLAYARKHRVRLAVDAAILLAWVVASAALFRWLRFPQWLHYLVLFAGTAVYAHLTRARSRPGGDCD